MSNSSSKSTDTGTVMSTKMEDSALLSRRSFVTNTGAVMAGGAAALGTGLGAAPVQAAAPCMRFDGAIKMRAHVQAFGFRCDVKHVEMTVGLQVGEPEEPAGLILRHHHVASVTAARRRVGDIGGRRPHRDLLGCVCARPVMAHGADVQRGERGGIVGMVGTEGGHDPLFSY